MSAGCVGDDPAPAQAGPERPENDAGALPGDASAPDGSEPPTPTGKLRWLRTVAAPSPSIIVFTGGAIDAEGNVLVTGIAQGSAASTSIAFGNGKVLTVASANNQESFIARYDAAGDCQWVTLVSGVGDEVLFRVAFSPTGEAIAIGESSTTSSSVTVDSVPISKPSNAGNRDVLVVKLDALGKRVWHKIFGGPAGDSAEALAVHTNGDIAIGGYVVRAAGTDNVAFPPRAVSYPPSPAKVAFVTLLDKDGAGKWAFGYPPGGTATSSNMSVLRSVTFDVLGDVVIAGDFDHSIDLRYGQSSAALSFQVLGTTGFDGFVAKLAGGDGKTSWGQRIGGTADDRAKDVTTDAARNIYVAGSYTGPGPITIGTHAMPIFGGVDAYVTKLDTSGTSYEWARGFGGPALQNVDSVAIDPWNNIVLGGTQDETVSWGGKSSIGGGGRDGFAVKLDTLAQTGLWAHGIGSTATDLVGRVGVAPATGRVVVTGGLNGAAVLAGQAVAIPDGGATPYAFVMTLDP
jgi:hypothetical protein